MADAIALCGIELIAKNLPAAVKDGKNLTARGAMLQAATFGATAFQKGLGACHSLAHPLSPSSARTTASPTRCACPRCSTSTPE